MLKIEFALVILLSIIFACGNPCDELDCGPNGTCIEDSESCLCDEYYEGLNCETEVRDKYLGSWNGNGVCNIIDFFDVNIDITKGNIVNEILISSDQILEGYSILGRLDEMKNIIITDFSMPNDSITYNGEIEDLLANQFRMRLNGYQNGVIIQSCEYTFYK